MNARITCSIFSVFVLFLFKQAEAQAPISLHAANPHYLEYKNKPVLLITSAEHYGALMNTDFDFIKYFDELHSKELNLTRIFTGVYCEPPGAFNIVNNTMAPLPGKLITPWARSTEPGYRNGGNKFDLNQWDQQYFSRLKTLMTEASKRNIIVEFTLFCPFYEDTMWIYSPMHPGNNVNNTPDIPRTDVYTLNKNGALLEIQKKLVQKLVTELNGFDNLMFEICNEPYFGGVMMDWQHAIADLIVETEKSLPKKHLITQNIANGASVIQDPHPAVSVFNYHYAYPPVTVQYNYGLNKVIGDNETGFRGVSDSTYRFEGWRFMLAGGGLFNHLDYSFTAGNEKGDFKYPGNHPGGGSDSLRLQLKFLKKFLEHFEFTKMKPDASLVDTTVTRFRFNALSEEGKQYALYLLDYSLPTITLAVPSGRYEAQWLDPITGKYGRPERTTAVNNKVVVKVPDHKADIALKLKRK